MEDRISQRVLIDKAKSGHCLSMPAITLADWISSSRAGWGKPNYGLGHAVKSGIGIIRGRMGNGFVYVLEAPVLTKIPSSPVSVDHYHSGL